MVRCRWVMPSICVVLLMGFLRVPLGAQAADNELSSPGIVERSLEAWTDAQAEPPDDWKAAEGTGGLVSAVERLASTPGRGAGNSILAGRLARVLERNDVALPESLRDLPEPDGRQRDWSLEDVQAVRMSLAFIVYEIAADDWDEAGGPRFPLALKVEILELLAHESPDLATAMHAAGALVLTAPATVPRPTAEGKLAARFRFPPEIAADALDAVLARSLDTGDGWDVNEAAGVATYFKMPLMPEEPVVRWYREDLTLQQAEAAYRSHLDTWAERLAKLAKADGPPDIETVIDEGEEVLKYLREHPQRLGVPDRRVREFNVTVEHPE